jgi:hypothetical protein
MDHYSILDQKPAAPVADKAGTERERSRVSRPGVSGGIAVASALVIKVADVERADEPAVAEVIEEDSGRTLAQMAVADLEAALQLLADRAQYITGASGAAIALRRGEHHDMLCRASAGSNAPELGALLSMDEGLSGECVRSRQPLLCDDASADPRVNRKVCIELGIASVVVMPIISDGSVLGVFELFSGDPRAFGERDLSTLTRLSQMVETALKHAAGAQATTAILEPAKPVHAADIDTPALKNPVSADLMPHQKDSLQPVAHLPQMSESKSGAGASLAAAANASVRPAAEKDKNDAAPKHKLLWSAGRQTQPRVETTSPPLIMRLQNCRACGFPVSSGRTLCVECEEKKWRGQKVPEAPAPEIGAPQVSDIKAALNHTQNTCIRDASSSPDLGDSVSPAGMNSGDSRLPAVAPTGTSQQAVAATRQEAVVESANQAANQADNNELHSNAASLSQFSITDLSLPHSTVAHAPLLSSDPSAPAVPHSDLAQSDLSGASSAAMSISVPEESAPDTSAPFLSSAMPSGSWLQENKYVIVTLTVVGIIAIVVNLLR